MSISKQKSVFTFTVLLAAIFIVLPSVHADIIITEVLTYAGSSGSAEDDCYQFIELYNAGASDVNVQDWRITDGDSEDVLTAYNEGAHGDIADPDCVFSTVIPAGGYGVVIDPEYTDGPQGEVFDFPSETRILTVAGSSTLGNTLAHYSDPVTLYTWDDVQGEAEIKSTYGTPNNAILSDPTTFDDNGQDCVPCRSRKQYSVECKNIFGADGESNWGLSSQLWGTPGAANTKSDKGAFTNIVITEVYANPSGSASDNPPPFTAEDTDEFVEIANTSSLPVDVFHWWITDGDGIDRIIPYDESTHGDIIDTDVITDTTVIPAGAVAVILDPDYTSGTQPFDFPADTIVLTCTGTSDSIGSSSKPSSGLTASSDPVTLFALRAGNYDPDNDGANEYDVANIAATYGTPELTDLSYFVRLDDDGQDGIPFNPGADHTVEMIDLTQGDVEGNWQASTGSYGTPGFVSSIVQSPSVVIDEGEYTEDPTIHLTLAADQADEMIISERADFAGASWEPYATARTWLLSAGDGLKTVFVKFRSAPAEESEVVSDSIVLNTSDAPILKVGSFNNGGQPFWIELVGDYAYVADLEQGLEILDITNISAISLVGTYYDGGEWLKVDVAGDYAYVAAGIEGLTILDIKDPANPYKIAEFDVGLKVWGVELLYGGTRACLASGYYGIKLVDVTDPRHPVELGSYDTPGFAADMVVVGNLCYVADYGNGLVVLDITNPGEISKVGHFTNIAAPTRNVTVQNKFVFLANHEAGLQVLDASNLRDIQEIAVFSDGLNGQARGITVRGSHAYLADHEEGLEILDISDITSISLLDRYYDGSGMSRMCRIRGEYIFVADSQGGMEVLRAPSYIDEPAGTLIMMGGKKP